MADVPHRTAWSVRRSWEAFLYTAVFCVCIGLLITLLTGEHLWENMIVSFSIGWSINIAFLLLGDFTARFLGPYAAPLCLTMLGLCTGLLISGSAVFGDPSYFFAGNLGALSLGIFFGLMGLVIFATRERLIQAEADLAKAEAERERQEKLRLETDLKLLQAQIEPHFLFNTLSNIAGLIHTEPNDAEQTLLNLTTLLRASLRRTREATVTLAQELEIARAYLDIHAIRMHGRLRYHIICADELGHRPLPPLLVQPLIENAIKHGIDPCEEGGDITIAVTEDAKSLCIVVTDNGVGISPTQSTAGTGTGLTNVRERINALYGDQATLALTENHPSGMICTLTLPL